MIIQESYKKGDAVPEEVASISSGKIRFNLPCEYISGVITEDFEPWLLVDGFKYDPEKHGKIITISSTDDDLHIEELCLNGSIFKEINK